MEFNTPAKELVQKRYSCRSYREELIPLDTVREMEVYIGRNSAAPLGSHIRFALTAASKGDDAALKGLGTYGVIKNPAAFIIGAMKKSRYCLEDFGYMMEKNILFATSLGLGSCWLGGSYTRSSFANRIACGDDERVPAVASAGLIADRRTAVDSAFRFAAGSRNRKSWDEIFFHGDFSRPLREEDAPSYRDALEMLRLAPSASNKQPWRIVKETGADTYHFFLCRSKSYGIGTKLIGMDDLQRIDMGIAMSHFELTAGESGLAGNWDILCNSVRPVKGCEYLVTWKGN